MINNLTSCCRRHSAPRQWIEATDCWWRQQLSLWCRCQLISSRKKHRAQKSGGVGCFVYLDCTYQFVTSWNLGSLVVPQVLRILPVLAAYQKGYNLVSSISVLSASSKPKAGYGLDSPWRRSERKTRQRPVVITEYRSVRTFRAQNNGAFFEPL